MPFPVSYRGEVPAPGAADRPHLLGGLAIALRREGARHIQVGAERLEFRVKWFAVGGSSPLTMTDSGRVAIRPGLEGSVMDYEVSVRPSAIAVTAVCLVWLGGALLLGAPLLLALMFAAVAWIVLLGLSYVTTRSAFASFLRRLAADRRPPAT